MADYNVGMPAGSVSTALSKALAMAIYPVSYGSDGTWRWITCSNGAVFAFAGNYGPATAAAGRVSDVSVSLPEGIFPAAPNMILCGMNSATTSAAFGGCQIYRGTSAEQSSDTVTLHIANSGAAQFSPGISVMAAYLPSGNINAIGGDTL